MITFPLMVIDMENISPQPAVLPTVSYLMRLAHLRASLHCAGRTMNVLLWASVLYMGGFHLSPMTRQMCQIKPHSSTSLYWGNQASRCGEPRPAPLCHFHRCSLAGSHASMNRLYFVSPQPSEAAGCVCSITSRIRLTFALPSTPALRSR